MKRVLPILQKGDVVDLVAPAFACSRQDLENGVRFLEAWGLHARVPEKVFGRDVLCSHDDKTRFQYFKNAVQARDSKAIWCLRGGYGSIRLMPWIARMPKPWQKKIFIGISDISTLSTHAMQEWGWSFVHGPLLDRLGQGRIRPREKRELHDLLFGLLDTVVFRGLRAMNAAARRRVVVRAPVTGGNLITLQSSLGTKYEWRPRGQIVFFEEIGERGYRIDRVLTHMQQAGTLQGVRAVIFGDFTGGREPDGSSRVWPVLQRFADEMSIPVLRGLPSGHDVIQRPVVMGIKADLSLGQRPSLVVKI